MNNTRLTIQDLKDVRFLGEDMILLGGRYYRAYVPLECAVYIKNAIMRAKDTPDGTEPLPTPRRNGLVEIPAPLLWEPKTFTEAFLSIVDEVLDDISTFYYIDLYGWSDEIPAVKDAAHDMQFAWLTVWREYPDITDPEEQLDCMMQELLDNWWFDLCGKEKARELCRLFGERMRASENWKPE